MHLRTCLIVLALLFRISIPALQTDILSPSIQLLSQDIQAGRPEVLERFYDNLCAKGTPLVENAPNGQALVTWVWFASHQNEIPIVISELVGSDNCMENLPETNLWYKSIPAPKNLRTLYGFVTDVNAVHTPFEEKYSPDPFNKNVYTYPEGTYSETQKIDFSILELPDAPQQPWVKRRDNMPRGKVAKYSFASETLENTRDIWIYTPSNYIPSGKKKYPLLIVFDGEAYMEVVSTRRILDNMIADKVIPPLIAVFVGSIDIETRCKELPCYDPFIETIVKEMIPWIKDEYTISLKPTDIIAAGSSYGGLAAIYAAIKYPEIIGNVLSMSGAFWWHPEDSPKTSWIITKMEKSPPLPIKLYLDAGTLEDDARQGSPSILTTNRQMSEVLQKKGYTFRYVEFGGAHEYISWQGNLSSGLIFLIGTGAR